MHIGQLIDFQEDIIQPKRVMLSNSGGFLSHDIYGLKLQFMIHMFYSQYLLRTN